MMKAIKAVDRGINKVLEILVIIMMIVMVVVVTAQLVSGWAHASLFWSEELSQYVMVWCAFFSGALCVRKGSMVGLEVAQMVLPKKAGKVLSIFVLLLQAFLLGWLAVVCFRMSASAWNNQTPILKISMGLVYSGIPIGFALMALNSLFCVVEKLREGKESEE